METLTLTPNHDSNIDTSRPFRSVKEAVAIFGGRILLKEFHSPKPHTNSPQNPNNDRPSVANTLKKLGAELEETKMELKKMKKRESETEVALASQNAELHKSMSKLAEAEAAAASKAVAARSSSAREDERRKELMMRMENSPSLGQIMSVSSEKEYGFGGNKKERKTKMKKKPIIPLVGELFSRKKGSPTASLRNFFYSSPLF